MSENTAPASTQVKTQNLASNKKDDCDQCLRGGMPLKKEFLSLFTLVLIALVTLLSVLLIQEKRKLGQWDGSGNPDIQVVPASIDNLSIPAAKFMSEIIELPAASVTSRVSLEEAIADRRSRRTFSENPVTQVELSQVLWSAQGVTDEKGHRAAPSAKSGYPYTLYAVVRNVEGLDAGLYQYLPEENSLGKLNLANAGQMLIDAQVQDGAQKAPVVVVMAVAYGKSAIEFPDNYKQVALLEGGHIGQNMYLQVESLGMSTVVMAGFNSIAVRDKLMLDEAEMPIYLIPFGHRVLETN
ncbi:MAG: SagB/ThcOx family dehydrogenase [Patescibacteria group bacterium]